jgi:aldose 1-epimerase
MFPSGEQIEIAHGDQSVVVTEVGAGIRSYTAGGRDVLDGYGVDQQASSGRGQLLVPWPNRIEDGSYVFEGRTHQLPLTEPANGNAIHGLVRWAAWTIAERADDRVLLEHVIHPQPGYPFTVEVSVELSLSNAGLLVRTLATNLGPDPCPYGAGAHPYLTLGTSTVDELVLTAPAGRVLVSNERGLPTGSESVDGTEFDFRAGRQIGETRLDNAFTDLERDPDNLARVMLRAPDGRQLTLWMDEAYGYAMIFTGDPLPDVARHAIAIEPMTCPPNAFRTGGSVVRLEPGQSTSGTWGITPP